MKRSRPLRRTALRRTRPPRRKTPLRPTSDLGRRRSLAASTAQRAKVAGRCCLVCGSPTRIDPAHLIPRSLSGCDEPDCVVALCRSHHRAYDSGRLDLLPALEPGARRELAHAVGHVGLLGTLRRVTGQRAP